MADEGSWSESENEELSIYKRANPGSICTRMYSLVLTPAGGGMLILSLLRAKMS